MKKFSILILTNSSSDLTLLKFKEFEIVNVKSEFFITFCKETNTNISFEDIIEIDYYKKPRYAIINKNLKKEFELYKIHDLFNFLLLLFPSTLHNEIILDYKLDNRKLSFFDVFKFGQISYPQDENEFLSFDKSDVNQINLFTENYFDKLQNINYIKFSIQNYINAFASNYTHLSLIAFCISLESITNGNSELLYRICRNVSVLCGKDDESGHIIFDNIKKIYGLRSKIVHGMEFQDDKVDKYLLYLQSISSKVIVELLIHDIKTVEILNKKITGIGFGDRHKISNNWNNIILNTKLENFIYKTI
tara:strand:+ start:61 stop:975 length:915 start_codon:yes stop_codon:yes gene_type:complete